MDVDPVESATGADEDNASSRDRERIRLNTWVAVTVALLATFLGICKIKDENIVQGMQRAQADKLDHWNFYQARNIRQDVASAAVTQLQVTAAGAPAAQQESYRAAISKYQALAADQAAKKDELRQQAEQDEKDYERLNNRHDQFDLSDAMITLAISLLALTALTHKKGLYWLAIAATVGGVLFGMAGLLGWHLYSGGLERLLS